MITPVRFFASASALAAAALLVAGCAASPGTTPPTNTGAPQTTAPATVAPDHDPDDFDAAWLDDGRMFAVVTWGSSSCVPMVDTVSADGQTVTVSLVDRTGEDVVCTADFAPRASTGVLPEGVDPTKDVELIVTLGDVTDDVDLDGSDELTGIPGTPTEYAPSAGWFDDRSLVLLTWGSSSCPPIVGSVESNGNAGRVTFTTDEDQICTMDMAPRATLISFTDEVEDDGFELTLVGDNLDGVVRVHGD